MWTPRCVRMPVTAQHVKDHVKGLRVVRPARHGCDSIPPASNSSHSRQGRPLVRVRLPVQVNGEIVSIQRVCTPAGEQQLKKLIQDHVDLTGSKKGAAILKDWSASLQKFWQLVPPSGVDPTSIIHHLSSPPAQAMPITGAAQT